jgi:uncharacterized protein YjbI with pentapeptide repeats
MTKIEIKNQWNRAVIYSCDVPDDVPSGMAFRHALEKAVANGADLSGAYLSSAYLSSANLRGAYLRGADLSGADLSGADLSGADLSGAYLSGADLSSAYLRGAYLRGADLSGANLSGANLSEQKNDFWAILLHAPAEIQGLRLALIEGRVDGSTYEGPCACLVGTIANVRNANYQDIGIKPDSSRPAEQWFMYIKKGDTPETNQISRFTVEWLDEFVILLNDARVNTYSHDAKIK